MRFAVFVLCLGLVAASLALGDLRIALALAGVKAVLVGFELMELRHASRLHLSGFAAFFVVLVAGLALAA